VLVLLVMLLTIPLELILYTTISMQNVLAFTHKPGYKCDVTDEREVDTDIQIESFRDCYTAIRQDSECYHYMDDLKWFAYIMNHPEVGCYCCTYGEEGLEWTKDEWGVWFIPWNSCTNWQWDQTWDSLQCGDIGSASCGNFVDDNQTIKYNDACCDCGGGDSEWLEFWVEMEANLTIDTPSEPPMFNSSDVPAPDPAIQTDSPSQEPTSEPTEVPSEYPTSEPSEAPSEHPMSEPSEAPSEYPTSWPSEAPTEYPTSEPSENPTGYPSDSTTAWSNYTIDDLIFDQIQFKNFDDASGISLSADTYIPELRLFFNNMDVSKVKIDLRQWGCYGINGTFAGNGVDNDQLRIKIWYGSSFENEKIGLDEQFSFWYTEYILNVTITIFPNWRYWTGMATLSDVTLYCSRNYSTSSSPTQASENVGDGLTSQTMIPNTTLVGDVIFNVEKVDFDTDGLQNIIATTLNNSLKEYGDIVELQAENVLIHANFSLECSLPVDDKEMVCNVPEIRRSEHMYNDSLLVMYSISLSVSEIVSIQLVDDLDRLEEALINSLRDEFMTFVSAALVSRSTLITTIVNCPSNCDVWFTGCGMPCYCEDSYLGRIGKGYWCEEGDCESESAAECQMFTTARESSSSEIMLIVGIVAVVLCVCLVIFIIVHRRNKSEKWINKDAKTSRMIIAMASYSNAEINRMSKKVSAIAVQNTEQVQGEGETYHMYQAPKYEEGDSLFFEPRKTNRGTRGETPEKPNVGITEGSGPGVISCDDNLDISPANDNIESYNNVKTISLKEVSNIVKPISLTQVTLDNEIFGHGSFGVVIKGTWAQMTVAVKKLKKPWHSMSLKEQEDFKLEITTGISLRHENIIRYYGYIEEPVCILMEFCPYGSLKDYFESNDESWTEKKGWETQLLNWALSAGKGVTYLHTEGMVHRDIAARNLLLTKHLEIRVSDFGMSRILGPDNSDENDQYGKTKTRVGPLKWMSPESIRLSKYSFKTDVYSFGIMMFEIFSLGLEPYEKISPIQAAFLAVGEGRRPDVKKMVFENTELVELMNICWESKADNRPEMEKVVEQLNHIITQYQNKSDPAKKIRHKQGSDGLAVPSKQQGSDGSVIDLSQCPSVVYGDADLFNTNYLNMPPNGVVPLLEYEK